MPQAATQLFETREEYLAAAVESLRPVWRDRAGLTVPDVRVGVGFPSQGLRSNVNGQCWKSAASGDLVNEITVRVTLSDAVQVLAVLGHELIHAAFDNKWGHGKRFSTAFQAVGFMGNPKDCVPGADLRENLKTLAEALGDYPGDSGLAVQLAKKAQVNRQILCLCGECGFKYRTTTKWIEAVRAKGSDLRCPDAECDGVVEVAGDPGSTPNDDD